MATETIDIRIREDGSRVVRRNLEDIGGSAERSAKGVDILKTALGTLATYLTASVVMKYADAWNTAQGMIRNATKSIEEATVVQERLFAAAQKTGSSYSAMVEMYSRVARGAKDMGKSQEDSIKFAEGVGKALKVQGTSAQTAQGALLQLGQMLSSNNVQMEEYASLLDSTPALLQIVANNMDGASGSVGRLTQMVKVGQITNTEFFEAFMKGQAELDKMYENSGASFSGAWQRIQDALMEYVGQLNEASAASKIFDSASQFIAANLKQIIAVLVTIAAVVATAFVPTAVIAFTAALRGLAAAALANPLLALAAAVVALTAYVAIYGDEINAGIDKTTSLLDVIRALGQIGGEVWDYLSRAFEDGTSAMFKSVKTSNEQSSNSYADFYSDVGSGFAGMAKGIARTIDAIAGLLTGLGIAIVRVFSGIPDVLSHIFSRAYNAVVDKLGGIANIAIQGINKIRQAAGAEPIQLVNFDKKAVSGKTPEQYGANIAKSIGDGFEMQGGFLESQVDKVFKRAQDIGKKRLKNTGSAGVDLTKSMGEKLGAFDDGKGKKSMGGQSAADKAAQELERFKSELESVITRIAPVDAAVKGLAKSEDTLNKALQNGLITTQQHGRYIELLKKQYEDAINPLGALNRELDKQTKLINMSAKEREVESQMMRYEQELRQKGVVMTQQESAALREKLVLMQKQNELGQARDQILANSVGQRNQFETQTQAMGQLKQDPSSGFTNAAASGMAMNALGSMGIETDGMQGQMEAQMGVIQNYYSQLIAMRDADLISEQDFSNAKVQLALRENELKTQNMRNFFGSVTSLQSSSVKELAAIGKAAAITQAIINTYEGATKAMAQGGIMGPAMAAAVVASGMAQVAAIRSQQTEGFLTGGNFKVGGSGGADSQMVAFRASPGEQVTVSTPTQVRKGTNATQGGNSAQAAPSVVTPKIINVLDPSVVGDYLGTDDGEQLIMNVVQRNQRSFG